MAYEQIQQQIIKALEEVNSSGERRKMDIAELLNEIKHDSQMEVINALNLLVINGVVISRRLPVCDVNRYFDFDYFYMLKDAGK